MNQAKVEQVGSPEEVFHHPASEFVIDFLGSVNVFSGRHLEGQAANSDADFDSSKMYVRPHELSITRHATDESSLPAKIQRIHRAGAHAKVFLQTALDQNVRVDIPITQCHALKLADGEQVYITPLNAHVFTNEFNI
jgi:sulfate transport system ATP-binding protein